MSNDFIYLEIDKRCNGRCNCTEKIGDFYAKREDGISDVIGFHKYSHKLKDEQTFTLNRRLGKNEQLEMKLNILRVLLFITGMEIQDTQNPFSWRYEEGESEALGNATIWKYVQGNHKLQDRLDDRNCGRNGAVPLNLQNLTSDKCFISSGCLKKERNIAESTPKSPKTPPGGEYTVREYTINGGAKISRVTHGKQNVDGIDLTKNGISKFRIYSHSNIPLMLQFIPRSTGTDSKWYYSTNSQGKNWQEISNHSKFYSDQGDEPTEALTTGLDDVRCLRNGEVTINLTKGISEGRQPYCCTYHSSGQEKVTVEPKTVSCKLAEHQGSSSITAYKHSISGGGLRLAGIKFYLNGDNAGTTPRTRIILNTQRFPISSLVSVYAFYCKENGNGPALIYVDGDTAEGWYQKNKDSESEWTKVDTGLQGITPEQLNSSTDHGKYNDLVNALSKAGCDYNQCTPSVITPTQGATASRQEADSHGTSQLFPGDKYVFGGLATVVSGLTGFVGFKFYKSRNGDPWVREI